MNRYGKLLLGIIALAGAGSRAQEPVGQAPWPAPDPLVRPLRLAGRPGGRPQTRASALQERSEAAAGSTQQERPGAAALTAVSTQQERPGAAASTAASAQQERPGTVFKVKVDMVVLSFTVTDGKGHYVTGLKPSDFRILEDGIPQKITTFAEGSKPAVQLMEDGATRPLPQADPGSDPKADLLARAETLAGTNVFVLFDTSNYMYRTFVYASDAIADFVRGLDRADSVSVYTFSRNLARVAPLTRDHNEAISGLRKATAGDDAALYNSLLLTLRDAAAAPGRKVVIVFSNGPDNASMIAPDDVRAVAEDEGIPIYVISTSDTSKDQVSAGIFRGLAQRTGGQVYFARSWQKQVEAFESIRDALGNSYSVTYYPQPNPNEGFRKISVEIPSDAAARKYRIRARPGYRPRTGP